MRIYLAGWETPIHKSILLENGVQNVLASYYKLNEEESPLHPDVHVLIDSGGYSARINDAVISVEDYAAYLNRHKIELAFNLDTSDVQETLDNQKYLEKETKTYILPIYHFSDFRDNRELLDDFLDYPYIAAGGVAGVVRDRKMKRHYFNYIFSKVLDKVKVHGLGVTDYDSLQNFPWYTTDSTTWIYAQKGGSFLTRRKDGRILGTPMYKVARDYATMPLNVAAMCTQKDRYCRLHHNIQMTLKMQEEITQLWAARGVVWKD